MNEPECGALQPSLRCYHWPFVWVAIISTLLVGIWIRGFVPGGTLILVASITVVLGYMFLLDISDSVWWTADQIWWRGWNYFSIKPKRHTVRITELTKVVSALHPANVAPGKPFDRILFTGPSDAVVVFTSFHRREELEELLRLVQRKRPETLVDTNVVEFMDGGFTDWWRYR